MHITDLQLPRRLLAGGGPASPDPRVLLALTTPLIGQFDPAFTAIMDDVVQLARLTFLTNNSRCFAVSGLASAGLESVLNSVLDEGDCIAIGGGPEFVAKTADIANRYGVETVSVGDSDSRTRLVVVPFVEPTSAKLTPIRDMAAACHERGLKLVVDATIGLGVCELRVDEWAIDACVAGADFGVGAPPGMTLLTYSSDMEAMMSSRRAPPRTSYLDLLQLQAYWSPERLNHHTAPTSLVYALREALRLIEDEGLDERWRRHHDIGQRLRDGLALLDLEATGDVPFSIVHLPSDVNEPEARQRLIEQFGVYLTKVGPRAWRLGLLGADARLDAVNRVLNAIEKVVAA
jgi:aspartate aminotransferase-like enzyme